MRVCISHLSRRSYLAIALLITVKYGPNTAKAAGMANMPPVLEYGRSGPRLSRPMLLVQGAVGCIAGRCVSI